MQVQAKSVVPTIVKNIFILKYKTICRENPVYSFFQLFCFLQIKLLNKIYIRKESLNMKGKIKELTNVEDFKKVYMVFSGQPYNEKYTDEELE